MAMHGPVRPAPERPESSAQARLVDWGLPAGCDLRLTPDEPRHVGFQIGINFPPGFSRDAFDVSRIDPVRSGS